MVEAGGGVAGRGGDKDAAVVVRPLELWDSVAATKSLPALTGVRKEKLTSGTHSLIRLPEFS